MSILSISLSIPIAALGHAKRSWAPTMNVSGSGRPRPQDGTAAVETRRADTKQARSASGSVIAGLLIAGLSGCAGGVSISPSVATTATTSPAASSTPSAAASALEVPILAGWSIVRTFEVPDSGAIAYGGGSLWVTSVKEDENGDRTGKLNQVDPETGELIATIEDVFGGFPAVGEGALWLITAERRQSVIRVEFPTREVSEFKTSSGEDPTPEAVVVTPGAVWVGNNHEGTVAKVSPDTLEVVKTIRLTEPGAFGVRGKAATDETSVWFGISRTGEIVRIDAASAQEVSRIRLPMVDHPNAPPDLNPSDLSAPEQLVVVGNRLYASTHDHIYVIDISQVGKERIVADLPIGQFFGPALDVGGDVVWALTPEPLSLYRLDTTTNTIGGRLPIDIKANPFGLAPGLTVVGDKVWVRVPDHLIEIGLG